MTNRVISGCLERIRKQHLDAVNVLLDYLQDIDDPRHQKLLLLWERWQANVNRFASRRSKPRRRYSAWEEIAFHHYGMWVAVGKLFGCRWAPKNSYVLFRDMPRVLGGIWKKNPVELATIG